MIEILNGKLTDVHVFEGSDKVEGLVIHGEPSRESAMWTHENVDVTLPKLVDATWETDEVGEYGDLVFEGGTIIGYVEAIQVKVL